MSKPKDPVLAVIQYFEVTDLALARQTLAIVQQTMRRRTPVPKKPVPKPKLQPHAPTDSASVS